jgi:hypothetical protein
MIDHKQQIDEVNAIIKGRAKFINKNYILIREAFQNEYQWPELDPLRFEICIALTFGLHQASITLTNHLLESLMKNSLIVFYGLKNENNEEINNEEINNEEINNEEINNEEINNEEINNDSTIKKFNSKFKEPIKNFGASNLKKNINELFKINLINEEQTNRLHALRDNMRNAYSHSDKGKLFGEHSITGQSVNFFKQEVNPPEDLKISEAVFLHGYMQSIMAENEAVPYFLEMDKLVRVLREKIFTS